MYIMHRGSYYVHSFLYLFSNSKSLQKMRDQDLRFSNDFIFLSDSMCRIYIIAKFL